MPKSNRLIEAFKESYNTIGLAGAVALSAALLNPAPLIAAIVAEAAYLLFVPDTKWYEMRLAKRFDAEVEERRRKLKEQTLLQLRPEMQQRFAHLEDTRRQIDAQSQDDKAWYREVLRKLDYLLEKFLMFASKEVQFRSYLDQLHQELRSAPTSHSRDRAREEPRHRANEREETRRHSQERDTPGQRSQPHMDIFDSRTPLPTDQWTQQAVEEIQARYEHESEQLRQSLEAETDEATRSILAKRIDILQRRNEFVGKIGRILINLNHQLQLVEDTFGLINDEIRARSPEQILADVEEVVVATDTMASSLEELASVEQMMTRFAS